MTGSIKFSVYLQWLRIKQKIETMKSYSFDKLPEINGVNAEEDIRTEIPVSILSFLKDALWDNLFVYRVANIAYLLLIFCGVLLAIFNGDIPRLVKCVLIVGVLKGILIVNMVKMFRNYRKAGIFPVVTNEGITHMFTICQGWKKYIRLSTMRWEDVKTLRVYRNFVSLEIKNIRSVKDDIGLAYIWDDDITALTEQILYRWKRALSESEMQSERLILYSEKDEAEVSGFIEDEFGPFSHVYHELLSTDMHIDIAMIPPHEGRNYYTLCTIGAGAYRMNVDSESRVKHQQPEHSEFMIYLPADWKLDEESLKDESNYWPIRLLKNTARLSRRTGSWLGEGHTIGSESGEPYSDKLPYNNSLLLFPAPYLTGVISHCNLSSGKTIAFHQILPLTQEELDYIYEHGTPEFIESLFPKECDIMETILSRFNR